MTDEGLLKDCRFDKLHSDYRMIAATDQAPVAKLGLYATFSMRHLINHIEPFQKLYGKGVFCSGFHAGEDSWHSGVVDLFTTTLEEAVHTGAIRAVETRRVATMFLDAILSLMARRLKTADPDDSEDDVRVLMDLYLNGLMTRY